MENNAPVQSKSRTPDGSVAFAAIIKDIGLVFHLDYRHATFKKWHMVAETALDMFLGPLHPKTLEFHSLPFKHAESPDIPEDKAVTHEDEMTYSAGLESSKSILEYAQNECRECEESEIRRINRLKEAALANGGAPVEQKPVEFKIIRSTAPGGSVHINFGMAAKPSQEAEAELADDPVGGIKIVARAGATGAQTLEAFIKGTDDPQERDLIIRLREVLDNPGSSWTDVKMIMEEILDFRRETALRLFPIIIKH